MKVNNKRNGSHHLPCLSGLSQTPLIGSSENGNNERLTPISAQSLIHHHSPPNRISFNQKNLQLQQQLQQHQQSRTTATTTISSTPQMVPNFACVSSNATIQKHETTVFFPTLAPRNNKQQQIILESNTVFNHAPQSPDNNSMNDLNMNAEHERDRERQQLEHEDENYHLYHEPLDIDDQEPTRAHKVPSDDFNKQQAPPQPPPLTPRLHALSNMSSPTEWHQNATSPRPPPQITPTTDRSPNLAPDQEQQLAQSISTNLQRHGSTSNSNSNSNSNQQQALTPAPFSDRSTSFRNDIADDVYFRYVHLKPSERANQRSRSYHGPKNSCNPTQIRDDQSLLKSESTNNSQAATNSSNRNPNSNSVTELQVSPIAILAPTPPIIPFRDHCVRELIETESNYVHALEMIITCFARPLEILLKRDDNQLIFGHIRNFHHTHSLLQADLVKAAFRLFNKDLPSLPSPTRKLASSNNNESNPTTPTSLALNNNSQFPNASPLSSPTTTAANPRGGDASTSANSNNVRALKISSCFLNAREKFLKYGEYCASLSKVQALLDELTSKNEAISAQLERCEHEANEGKFKLRDLLSLPMQRILKYHLLLAQLIKNTSSSNDDYQGLKRAHETMVDLGQYINEVKRDTEATQIMTEIEQSIVGLNMPDNTRLLDYGRLITDGFVRIKAPQETRAKSSHELTKIKLATTNDTKLKPKRYVFVFDKVMLVCKLSGLRRYQYKEALLLSEFEIEPNPSVPSDTLNGKHAARDKWGFMFNLIRSCDGTTYSFFAKTMEMKNKWVSAIQRAMDNVRPAACRSQNNNAGSHEFLMHCFDKASSCDHCGKLLLGLYYQGYRCRVCFTSVHKKCLSSVRSCGPALPPKSTSAATISRSSAQRHSRCMNEPPSPSMQSNCSENGFFMHFPTPNSLSVQHTDALAMRNEYNNLENGNAEGGGKSAAASSSSSSFRENGARATTSTMGQRPVSSMINVSLQNSTNQIIQQKRLLRGSTSTPSINRQPSQRVRAIDDYDGDENKRELKMIAGDVILLGDDGGSAPNLRSSNDDVNKIMHKLTLGSPSSNNNTEGSGSSNCLFGRNLRTGLEGRFPAMIVENVPSENDTRDHFEMDTCKSPNSYVNFPLSDQPWFNDRMDRDKAQEILEGLPHGTFLVRVSPKHHNSYVISLKYNNKVMHMRVYVAKDNQLYLSQNRYFNSLVELVSWYEKNSLIESFNMLDACLAYPYKFRTSC